MIRNPLLALPEVAELRALPIEDRVALRRLLLALARRADRDAEIAWRRRKGPMAAYWRAVATYAKHTARAILRSGESGAGELPM